MLCVATTEIHIVHTNLQVSRELFQLIAIRLEMSDAISLYPDLVFALVKVCDSLSLSASGMISLSCLLCVYAYLSFLVTLS